MADNYFSILNEGEPKQVSPIEAYQNAVKLGQQTQEHQQNTAYRQQEIAASQSRAQLAQTENDQKQRTIQGSKTLAEAIAQNTTYDDNGLPSTNYVAVHKHLNDAGFADLGTTVDDKAVKDVKDRLDVVRNNAEYAGGQFGSVETPDWNDQNAVLRSQDQYNRAITAAQQAGAIQPQTAAQLRQENVNYTPATEAHRQQLLKQAIPKVTEQAEYAGKTIDNLHKQRMNPSEEATAAATAQEKQQAATGGLLAAGAAPPDSGYPTGSASGPYGAAPAGGYPTQYIPAAGAPAQTAPQRAPEPSNPSTAVQSTGEIDLGYGIPQKPAPTATPPPAAAGTPAQTVPASKATAPVVRTAPQQGQPSTAPGTPALGSTPAPATAAAPLGKYDTKLTPAQEAQFQVWKAKNAPNDSGEDYDLRGLFLSGQGTDQRGHATDQFKKPNHPTFSDESQYSGKDGNVGGHWGDNGTFTPGATNLKNHSPAELQQYFKQNEPETKLNLPGGAAVDQATLTGKNPDGTTHWTQAGLDAWRGSPSVSTIKGSIPAKEGPAADAIMAKLGLTKEQQITNEDREAKAASSGDKVKAASRDLGAQAERGPGSYAIAWSKLDPEMQKIFPDPDKWDADKTPKQVRMVGMTPSEQENADTKGGEKPATRVQYDKVQSDKSSAQRKAFDELQADLKTAQYDPAAWDEAHQKYKTRLQEVQRDYEAGIGTLKGEPIAHNPWADNYTPPAFPTKKTPAKAAAPGIMERVFGGGAKPAATTTPATASASAPSAAPTKGQKQTYNGAGYEFDGQVWRRQ